MWTKQAAFATHKSLCRNRLPSRPSIHVFPQHASFLLADEAATALSSPQTSFEPVLNVPALGSFVLIMTMALLLRLRVNAIGEAAEQRIAALKRLRETKSKELSNEATYEQVQAAVADYEMALKLEEQRRTLLPGVRLRAPNNPLNSELDQQAARQFLGANNTATQSAQAPQDDPPSNLPPFALGTLWAFIFGSQILLFLFLSMNDTMANELFQSILSSNGSSGGMGMSGGDMDAVNAMGITPSSTVAETVGDLISME